jgi:hypothetical protein
MYFYLGRNKVVKKPRLVFTNPYSTYTNFEENIILRGYIFFPVHVLYIIAVEKLGCATAKRYH